MRTTILILSVDEAPLLAYSLPAAMLQDDADVLVVDNACADATGSLAHQHGARLMRTSRRLSYAAAMNFALSEVKSDSVLILNADCFLDPGYLAAARPRLEEDGVGSVAGRLLRVPGPVEEPDAVDAAGMCVDRRRKNGLVGHGAPLTAYTRAGECFGADGACALYRGEVLRECGPEVFDEDMALWATDADLAWRARLLGWRCVYEPSAVARHVRTYSPSKRAQASEAHKRLQFRNRLLMLAKNETRAGLAGDLPRILGYEVLALGHSVLRERFLLRGYVAAAAALPATRRRRRALQARRTVETVPFGLEPPR